MKIGIGNDHTAVDLKYTIKEYLESKGYEVVNYGTEDRERCDYPIYGEKVANAVASGEVDLGILTCGTGVGISLAANKVKGIRAAVVTNAFCAKATREHNDANILCMGGRVITEKDAVEFTKIFLTTEFEGGRHQRRIDQIAAIEQENQ